MSVKSMHTALMEMAQNQLDEAVKFTHVLVDKDNKVVAAGSDEKAVKQSLSTAHMPPMSIKDKSTLKIVKLKKPANQKRLDRMMVRGLDEERAAWVPESVDYGSRMTDAQKKKFHDLKKKMTGGPEYQKIMRKNQSPVKSDDEFHNLVLKKVMSEERAAWVPESIADEQVEAFMEATLAAVTEGADTFVFEGKHYKAKSKSEAKKLDPVGKADADIDNDGDVDSSDDYLKNRRKAIKKSMKDDDDDEVNEIDGAASGMRAADKEPTVNLKALKKRRAAEKARKTARPNPLRGKKDMKFESVEVEEAKAPGATAQHGPDANTQDTFEKQLSTRKGEKDFVDQHSMEVGMDIEKITAENKKSIEDALKVTPPRMGDQKTGDNSFVSPIQSNIIDGITKALQQMKTNN